MNSYKISGLVLLTQMDAQKIILSVTLGVSIISLFVMGIFNINATIELSKNQDAQKQTFVQTNATLVSTRSFVLGGVDYNYYTLQVFPDPSLVELTQPYMQEFDQFSDTLFINLCPFQPLDIERTKQCLIHENVSPLSLLEPSLQYEINVTSALAIILLSTTAILMIGYAFMVIRKQHFNQISYESL